MTFSERIEESRREAVVHLLTIRKLKNPDSVVKVADDVYAHTNAAGRTKHYHVFPTFHAYQKSPYYLGYPMVRLMGYCIVIVEQSSLD